MSEFELKVTKKISNSSSFQLLEIDLKKWHNIAGKTGEMYG
jgi:hypothetical protein